jgi:hypothetical protein
MFIGSLISALGTAFAVGVFFANITIAIGVHRDAEKLFRSARKELKIFSPGSWAFICLFGSLPALAIYWAAHYSTFAKE